MAMLQHVGAAAPGLAAPERPEKGDARELGGGAGIEVQGKADSLDSGSQPGAGQALPADQAEAHERTRIAEKRLATVRAELAFKAVTVHVVDGGFLACRCGYCKMLPAIEALEQFAVQLGARSAA